MAPEVLRSEVYAASDLWAVGVMAYQLLSGKFPFNDKQNPYNPSLSKVWKSILTDDLKLSGSAWEDISDEAKDFVRCLLERDHTKRPSAKEALKHPWLKGTIKERTKGPHLSLQVIERIQRYSHSSIFKRSVLEMIAEDLIAMEEEDANISNMTDNDVNMMSICPLGEEGHPVIDTPHASPLEYLYERLKFIDKNLVDRSVLAEGLRDLGYKLTDDEVDRLLDQLDVSMTGQVNKSQLAASQIDWKYLQQNNTEKWLKYVYQVFSELDADKDGVLSAEEIMALLRRKLPPSEVEGALRDALAESARQKHRHDPATQATLNSLDNDDVLTNEIKDSDFFTDQSLRDGLNFRQFLRLLSSGSCDSLDIYDGRTASQGSSVHRTSIDDVNRILENSVRGSKRLASKPAAVEVTDMQ
jgi:calcium-dependent protein kinase